MKPKPVVPRVRAEQDVDEAMRYDLSENAPDAALGFIDALEQAYDRIGRHPDAGSSRYAGELDVPGLRCWRVLHGMRDIPAWMQDPELI